MSCVCTQDLFQEKTTSTGKYVCAGTIFGRSKQGELMEFRRVVTLPKEGVFLAQVALAMVYPYGGDLDDADVVFADIAEIDGEPTALRYAPTFASWVRSEEKPGMLEGVFAPWSAGTPTTGLGGAWGGLLGEMAPQKLAFKPAFGGAVTYEPQKPTPGNMGVSTYVGNIGQTITFRLGVNGDDCVAASFMLIQL